MFTSWNAETEPFIPVLRMMCSEDWLPIKLVKEPNIPGAEDRSNYDTRKFVKAIPMHCDGKFKSSG